MFLWYPVLARAPRRTARKKGSGYENANYRKANVTIKAIFIKFIMWSVFSNVKHKLRIFSHIQYLYKHTHTEESLPLTYL